MKKLKLVALLTCLVVFTTSMVSCGEKQSENKTNVQNIISASDMSKVPSNATKRKDNIVVSVSDISGVFNPLYADSINDTYVNELVFSSLVEFDVKGNPIDGMATHTESKDNLKHTFDLKDVSFTNGKKVTSDDVEFTFMVMADSSFTGLYDIISMGVKGADKYRDGDAKTIEGVKKTDKDTVEITLNEPNSTFIYNLNFGILSKEYYGKGYVKGDTSSIEKFFDKPMGSGQYSLEKYEAGSMVKLSSNEKYFKGKPSIKSITMSVAPAGDEVSKVTLGDSDVTVVPATENYLKAAQDAKFINIYRYASNSYGYIGFNVANETLGDKLVRQAIAYATNREGVVKQVFGQFGKVISIPESTLSWAYTTEKIESYKFNFKKAEELLAQAGYVKNSKGYLEKAGKELEIKMIAESPNEVTDVLLPVMKDDLGKIGVKFNIVNTDYATMVDKVLAGDAEMWFLSWGLSADPGASSSVFASDGAMNLYAYSNESLDEAYKNAKITNNLEKRKETYAKAYKILNDDLPCIPVYQRDDLFVISGRISNITVSPYRSIFADMYQVKLSK
jgi:peptide/nickel transport system substrate-binding protein